MLRKSMSNQVASYVMHELKAKQQAEAEAAKQAAASDDSKVLPN